MILVVDDKPENIFSLRRTLELNNFEVDSAASGEEALKKILDNSYSLIILDVQMPGMDGFEVAELMSGYSKSGEIPIIFLSAVNTDKKFIKKGYVSGAIDYVTKPVDPDIFMLKVKTLHKLYEQKRELQRMHASLREEVDMRKRTEDELSKRVSELHSVLESMPHIAFTCKPDGTLEYVNELWYLYSPDISELPQFHPDDACAADEWQESITKGQSFSKELRMRHRETGEYRYHLMKVIPVRSNNEIVKWVGTLTDIHAQKTASEILERKVDERTSELLEKNEELESINHDLQQFASVASHDLKEPLRKIQIFGSILQNRFDREKDPAADTVNRIVDASRRMSSLINDLLSYSRLSINSFFRKTDLEAVVKEIISDLEIRIDEKKATIRVGNMPEIDAIPGQIRQMFQNLIGNSLKFSLPDAPPVIDIEAVLVNERSLDAGPVNEGKYCKITVSDNGIGFDEKYKEKIFTIFQRLNNKEEYEGTGIGLAIVKKIVDKHGGLISAQSIPGSGATFTILLPVEQVTQLKPEEV